MGKIAGSEIDGIQGNEEVDRVCLSAEIVVGGIELRAGYFAQR